MACYELLGPTLLSAVGERAWWRGVGEATSNGAVLPASPKLVISRYLDSWCNPKQCTPTLAFQSVESNSKKP